MSFWSGVSEVRSGVFSAVFAGLGAGVVTLLVLKNLLKDIQLGELLRVQGNILKALEECMGLAEDELDCSGQHGAEDDAERPVWSRGEQAHSGCSPRL